MSKGRKSLIVYCLSSKRYLIIFHLYKVRQNRSKTVGFMYYKIQSGLGVKLVFVKAIHLCPSVVHSMRPKGRPNDETILPVDL